MAMTELPTAAIRFMNLFGQPQSHGATLTGMNKAEFLQLVGVTPIQPYDMYRSTQLAIDAAENIRSEGKRVRKVGIVLPLAKSMIFES